MQNVLKLKNMHCKDSSYFESFLSKSNVLDLLICIWKFNNKKKIWCLQLIGVIYNCLNGFHIFVSFFSRLHTSMDIYCCAKGCVIKESPLHRCTLYIC